MEQNLFGGQFSFNDFQNSASANASNADRQKIGFFKLKDDGDEALVRINLSDVNQMQFAAVHTVQSQGKWMKIACLNPFGNPGASCPLCEKANSGNTAISKSSKKVYIQMLAAYKDAATGTFGAPVPVIWERPAGFSRDLATILKEYGSLTDHLFKITRNGKAGDMKTTYAFNYAIPTVYKPELIPANFEAFKDFNVAKHSYWVKSEQEIAVFLSTGAFPEAVRETTNNSTTNFAMSNPTVAPAPVYNTPVTASQPLFNYTTTAGNVAEPGAQAPAGIGNIPTGPVAGIAPQAPATPAAQPAAGYNANGGFKGFTF